jgi:hypothetical protein
LSALKLLYQAASQRSIAVPRYTQCLSSGFHLMSVRSSVIAGVSEGDHLTEQIAELGRQLLTDLISIASTRHAH